MVRSRFAPKRSLQQRGAAFVEFAVVLGALLPAIMAIVMFLGAGGLGQVDRRMDLAATLAVAPGLIWADDLVYINPAGLQDINPQLSGEGGEAQLKNMLRGALKRVWSAQSFKDGDKLCIRLASVETTNSGSAAGIKTHSSTSYGLEQGDDACVTTDESVPIACRNLIFTSVVGRQYVVFVHPDRESNQIKSWECEVGYPTVQAGGYSS